MRSMNFYKGQVKAAVHEATKGKQTDRVIAAIKMLEGVVAEYQAILDRRASERKS
jgi:hypothetical protein